MEAGNKLQTDRENELEWTDGLIYPLFIASVVIYSVGILAILTAIVLSSCLLKTEGRRCKSKASITWLAAMVMILCSSISACFFSLGIKSTNSQCEVLDFTEQ